MKIIGTDNYAREDVADTLHSEGYASREEAQEICNKLNDGGSTYYIVVEDDHRLWRGMEDLV